jgi:hypothetical protein
MVKKSKTLIIDSKNYLDRNANDLTIYLDDELNKISLFERRLTC